MKKFFLSAVTTVVLLFGLENQVSAKNFTWTGSSSGAWNVATNWTPGTAYPGQTGTTDTAIFANGTFSITAVPNNRTLGLLLISNAGGNANVTLTSTNNATLTTRIFRVETACSVAFSTNLTVEVSGTSTYSNSGTVSGPGTIQFNSTATIPAGAGTGGVFGATPPGVDVNTTNLNVTLDNSTTVGDLTISNNTSALALNSDTITVNGTFSNSARNAGYGLVGPGTIAFNATNSFPEGDGNNGIFTANPNVIVQAGKAVTNTGSTAIGTLTVNSTGSLTISNGSTLTLNGTLSNSGIIQGQSTTATGTIQFNVATSFPQGLGSGGTFSSVNPLRVTVNGAITVAADANSTINLLTIKTASGILNDAGNIITVRGNIANSGAHNSSTGGSITLTGSTAIRTLSGGGSYGNLTLNDARGANVSDNTTVNGALTLSNGILSPAFGSDTVFVSSTGSVSSPGTGWVNGFLAEYFSPSGSAVSKNFEVGGSAVGSYRPVTVTLSSVSAPGYILVSNITGAYNLAPLPISLTQNVAAYWTILNHSITYPAASLEFSYQPADISGTQSKFVAQNYVIDNQNSSYGRWLSGWTSTNPTATSTKASGVTTFGDFIIGDTIQIPVVITPAGPLTFCEGGSVVLYSSVGIAGNYTYNWYQNSTLLNNHGIDYTATASGLYYLQIKNTSNNNLYYSDSILVTVNPLPTVNAGSALSGNCPGKPTLALGGLFGGSATGAVWSDGGAGGTFANNGGLTPNTTTYTSYDSAISSVTLTLTTTGSPCGTVMATKTLTFQALPNLPSISYTAPARICGRTPVLISNISPDAYTYQWMLNDNPIAGATAKQYAADSAGKYRVYVTNPATGCSIRSATVAVTRMPYIVEDTIALACNAPATTISLTSPTLYSYSTLPATCNVDMTNASISNTTGTFGGSARRIICNGGNLTCNGGCGAGIFVVQPGGILTGFTGSGSNTVYVKSGGTFISNATDGAGHSTTVYFEPGAIISKGISGYAYIQCTDIGVIYPANISLCVPYTYKWSTGDSTPTITVNPTLTTTYYVTVSAGSFTCNDSVVVVRTSSSAVISGIPNSICQGSSAVLTVNGASGAIQWQSSVSTTNFSDIQGATSNSYTSTPSQTTYYRVYSPNANSSCSDTTGIFKLLVNPLPSPPTLTAVKDSICSGDATQVCAPDTFSGYLWSNGATTNCTNAVNAGGYWVSVTTTGGCPTVSNHKSIYVYPVTSVSIVVQTDTFSSFGGVAYQWLLNGSMIDGATANFYVAKQSGNYSVQVTDSYGCIAESSPVAFVFNGVSNLLSDMVFEVYPNPAASDIQLKVGSEWIGKGYELYDVFGKVVTTGITRNEISIIDISAIAPGVYFVKINEYVRKFMKL